MAKKRIIKAEATEPLRKECSINYDFMAEPSEEVLANAELHAQEFVATMEAKERERKEQKRMEADSTKTVTIMKYQAKDGKYYFIVKDKFDIADEVERLDAMNALRDEMLASGDMIKHLWTKETVLF